MSVVVLINEDFDAILSGARIAARAQVSVRFDDKNAVVLVDHQAYRSDDLWMLRD
jgi:hypothetical protein